MQELARLLKKCETAIRFKNLKHRIRCFAHIINICSSHVIVAMSPDYKMPDVKIFDCTMDSDSDSEDDNNENDNSGTVPGDDKNDGKDDGGDDDDDDDDYNDDDNDNDNDNGSGSGSGTDSQDTSLDNLLDDFRSTDHLNALRWSEGLKRNSLVRARNLIRFLRSSDDRRTHFLNFIQEGNEKNLFIITGEDGMEVTKLPVVQLLRDVKTRWDSVYLMLDRLRTLRPVCCLTDGN
jgi:hypothetical protein